MPAKKAEKLSRVVASLDATPNSTIIANSIFSARHRRGLTLAQVAAVTDLDKGYLSRVERGQKSPSISTLMKIAQALDVQIGHLFGETTSDDAITVIKRDKHLDIGDRNGATGLLEAILPASNKRRLSAFIVEPGIDLDTMGADHPGDELIYILEGSITIDFPDRSIDLELGDCIHFDGHLRHQLRKSGSAPARALVIIGQDASLQPD